MRSKRIVPLRGRYGPSLQARNGVARPRAVSVSGAASGEGGGRVSAPPNSCVLLTNRHNRQPTLAFTSKCKDSTVDERELG